MYYIVCLFSAGIVDAAQDTVRGIPRAELRQGVLSLSATTELRELRHEASEFETTRRTTAGSAQLHCHDTVTIILLYSHTYLVRSQGQLATGLSWNKKLQISMYLSRLETSRFSDSLLTRFRGETGKYVKN